VFFARLLASIQPVYLRNLSARYIDSNVLVFLLASSNAEKIPKIQAATACFSHALHGSY
jgi:hypothetical protein